MELRISSVCDGVFGRLSSTGGSFFGMDPFLSPAACALVGDLPAAEASLLDTNTGLSYRTNDCPGVMFVRKDANAERGNGIISLFPLLLALIFYFG